ncbi:MAG: hypothetical protein GY759_08615 [Chloroflexi bacterium]|nr:hypothetical protein [Chloroflexota bacterium]
MALYPQSSNRRPSVQYLPTPYKQEEEAQTAAAILDIAKIGVL